MNIPTSLRTIPDATGKPAFVVVPIKDYATMVAKALGITVDRLPIQ